MSLFQAFVLGIVQGLTEFIPVSSDGHLTLVPFMLGWSEPGLAFTVALHIGTLIAVVVYFRAEVMVLARTLFGWGKASQTERKLLVLLAIGSVPAALVGLLFNSTIEESFERPVLAALLLGVTGFVLLSTETKVAHREGEPQRTVDDVTQRDAAIIGVAQATALLPGISRSGMTISAGMRLGLEREQAARFSFLLAIPITIGAILLELPDMADHISATGAGAVFIGVVASAVSGFAAISWLLGLLRRRDMRPFGTYLVFAMIAGFLAALARG